MKKKTLTPSQKQSLERLLNERHVFLTGEAGSGKTSVVERFTQYVDKKKFPVLASTGAAAVLIGGRTFHSFFGLGIMEGGVDKTAERALEDRRVVRRLRKIEGVVIDEVSMLPGSTLEAAEMIARGARESSEPWGGLRIIAVGDFAQLPPIAQGFEKDRPWAFLNPVWKATGFTPSLLERNMRTQNQDFLDVLNAVRKGAITRFVRDYLNACRAETSRFEETTRLFARRRPTEEYNLARLEELEGEPKTFPSQYSGGTRAVQQLKKFSPLPEVIHLKEGALVMLRYNDPKKRWVNGTTAFVEKINSASIRLALKNGKSVDVEPVSFSLLDADGHARATVTNFPLSLAYATTIHKAQGMTLDALTVDLRGLWEPGQAYVALSRVKSPKKLKIENWEESSIVTDPVVSRFYDSLQQQAST